MKSKFSYCQSQIEGHTKCKVQCDHCKIYYKPLEEEKQESMIDKMTPYVNQISECQTKINFAIAKARRTGQTPSY